jgi:hypothetical protein
MAAIELQQLPRDCPHWDYATHPNCRELLPRAIAKSLHQLRRGWMDSLGTATDTREVHESWFLPYTVKGYEYYAGHYRGESLRCLKNYRVMVHGDASVGAEPAQVRDAMRDLAEIIRCAIVGLDECHKKPDSHLSRRDKLFGTVAVAARVFEYFLRIHPYANGNGHAARFLIWAILGRYGYWPKKWTVEPRPPEPYVNALRSYRSGNPRMLEQRILDSF